MCYSTWSVMKPDWSELIINKSYGYFMELMKLNLKAESLLENDCKLLQNIMNHLPFRLKSFSIWEAGEAMKQNFF